MPNELDKQAKHYHKETSVNYSSYIYPYRYDVVRNYMVGPDVLELGVGHGDFTKWVYEAGFNLISVDGSIEAISYAEEKIGKPNSVVFLNCLFDEFFEMNYQYRYDDILITNTLEHIEDPVNLLTEASALLKPGGSIHITVPNAISYHRLLGEEMGLIDTVFSLNEHDISVGHKRVYNNASLDEDIKNANLFVASTEGIMFKPFSNSQLWPIIQKEGERLTDALFTLGKLNENYAAEIYKRCVR